MRKTHFKLAAILLLYACATLQFVRFYAVNALFYLNLPAYLSGHERLPFQERVLPILILRTFSTLGLDKFTNHAQGAFTPQRAGLLLISLPSVVVAGIFAQMLYAKLTRLGSLRILVYPTFIFALMWSYSIHVEANFSYPYDFLAVAFFTAGIYFIYTRKFIPLTAVMVLGTLNRETTLFLIGIYILDSATSERGNPLDDLRKSLTLSFVSWFRVAILITIWGCIKLLLTIRFAHNDASENIVRIGENLGRLGPRLWPALLNICGYLLPAVLLYVRGLYPVRFRNYFWIVPAWIAVAFYTGVIVETRIYGELCSLTAIGLVLLLERSVETMALTQIPSDELAHDVPSEKTASTTRISNTPFM